MLRRLLCASARLCSSSAEESVSSIIRLSPCVQSCADAPWAPRMLRECSTAALEAADATATYPALTSRQVKRMKGILRAREETASKLQSLMAKKEVGENLHLQVRKWAPLMLSGHDEAAQEPVILPGHVFNRYSNPRLLHLVVKWQLAKRRAGTHSTKTRAEVRGGGRKPWKQKGTGRSRQGSIRAPQWRGGGIVHGPKPRDHSFKVNRQVRRAALKCALSAKARAGQLIIVDKLTLDRDEAEQLLALRLKLIEAELEDLVSDRVKHPGFSLRLWVMKTIDVTKISAGLSPVDGIMARFKEEGHDLTNTQARTAVYQKAIPKLLPESWDLLPEDMQRSNEIVRMLNVGMDVQRLDKQEARRVPGARMSVLIIDSSKEGEDGGQLMRRGISNLAMVNALPVAGANVYDILKHEYLVMTLPAVEALVARLTRPLNRKFKPLGYDWQEWVKQESAKRAECMERAKQFPKWLAAVKAQRGGPPEGA